MMMILPTLTCNWLLLLLLLCHRRIARRRRRRCCRFLNEILNVHVGNVLSRSLLTSSRLLLLRMEVMCGIVEKFKRFNLWLNICVALLRVDSYLWHIIVNHIIVIVV